MLLRVLYWVVWLGTRRGEIEGGEVVLEAVLKVTGVVSWAIVAIG